MIATLPKAARFGEPALAHKSKTLAPRLMNPALETLLACPACRQELSSVRSELRCPVCEVGFPIVEGVPVFLGPDAEVVLVPATHASNSLGAEFEGILRRTNERILHLGAGSSEKKYPGCIELEHKIFRHTDVVGDAHALPFRDEVFDRVFAFNVFEHLREPALAAREIHRVLKPGGEVVLHTAFLQPLHEAPHHYYNATEFGVREWFREFEIERCEVSGNFSPGFMLGFISATLLEAVRETGAAPETQNDVASSTLGQWAEFWRQKQETPPGFGALLTLPPELQKRVAAGFELRACKRVSTRTSRACGG
jgi:SAM-dependent methyltransferase